MYITTSQGKQWWRMPVISGGRWRQEDIEFEASLDYRAKTLAQK
jgi:hypothetical protein